MYPFPNHQPSKTEEKLLFAKVEASRNRNIRTLSFKIAASFSLSASKQKGHSAVLTLSQSLRLELIFGLLPILEQL